MRSWRDNSSRNARKDEKYTSTPRERCSDGYCGLRPSLCSPRWPSAFGSIGRVRAVPAPPASADGVTQQLLPQSNSVRWPIYVPASAFPIEMLVAGPQRAQPLRITLVTVGVVAIWRGLPALARWRRQLYLGTVTDEKSKNGC